jgi:hypothetical protein
MNIRSFSKGFPVGYQWISIILLIAFLCFASIYHSYATALFPANIEHHDQSIGAGIYDFSDIFSPTPNRSAEK